MADTNKFPVDLIKRIAQQFKTVNKDMASLIKDVSLNGRVFTFTFVDGSTKDLTLSASATGGGAEYTTTVSNSRSSDIAANTSYTVPEYEMGTSAVQIYIDGVLIVPGVEWEEESSTSVIFKDVVSADSSMVIITRN